jgi:plastocyanin
MSRGRLGSMAAMALAVAALVPAVALGGGANTASTHTVVLKSIRFHPGTLTIHRGDSVQWLWRDNTEHNVTFHSFHSKTKEFGSYTIRFTHSGTFNYHCTIHVSEGMHGSIVVH